MHPLRPRPTPCHLYKTTTFLHRPWSLHIRVQFCSTCICDTKMKSGEPPKQLMGVGARGQGGVCAASLQMRRNSSTSLARGAELAKEGCLRISRNICYQSWRPPAGSPAHFSSTGRPRGWATSGPTSPASLLLSPPPAVAQQQSLKPRGLRRALQPESPSPSRCDPTPGRLGFLPLTAAPPPPPTTSQCPA